MSTIVMSNVGKQETARAVKAKERGNLLFRAGRFREAAQMYSLALALAPAACALRHEVDGLAHVRAACLSNRAAALLAIGWHVSAVSLSLSLSVCVCVCVCVCLCLCLCLCVNVLHRYCPEQVLDASAASAEIAHATNVRRKESVLHAEDGKQLRQLLKKVHVRRWFLCLSLARSLS